ncbi:MAG: anthranilate synthase component I family protein [Planctomycetota bacterium]|nr:anthranilate synthase component I family protein [Planctomycetota bacterium]
MTIPVIRRWFTASGGLVAELDPQLDAAGVFARLAHLPHVLFLDSALADQPAAAIRLGRYSFVAADPIHSLCVASDAPDPAAEIARALAASRQLLADLACPTIPGLPPFQGGLAGLLSYECGLAVLGLAAPAPRITPAPLLSLHAYDVVFAFDHDTQQGWAISQGIPAQGPQARRRRASERLETLLSPVPQASACESAPFGRLKPAPHVAQASACESASAHECRHPLPSHPHVRSTFTREAYLDMVAAGIEFVRAGDIFQVNLAQQLAVEAAVDPIAVYHAARRCNPAPFAGYFDAGAVAIASMSPERFLQVNGGTVRMHPIKGTRRVIASPEADLYTADELGSSAKDRAENVMIVDLVRNDLARVCRPESVRVESLCRLERYRYVQHLVSIVVGRLRDGLQALDAVEAAIPGGSITGAPKHRACEIISTLEGVARGPYCGSLGYLGFDGAADFNLLIRTFVITPDRVTFAAGGGITVRSDPAAEYEETLHKAEGMLQALDATLAPPMPATTAESQP